MAKIKQPNWKNTNPNKVKPSKTLEQSFNITDPDFGGVRTSKRDNKKEYIPKEQKKY